MITAIPSLKNHLSSAFLGSSLCLSLQLLTGCKTTHFLPNSGAEAMIKTSTPCPSAAPRATIIFDTQQHLTLFNTTAQGMFLDDSSQAANKWFGMVGRHHMLLNMGNNREVYQNWLSPLHAVKDKSRSERARAVDEYIDKKIKYRKEQHDRWSPPPETIARGEGDCDDYAILKYYACIAVGIPADKVFVAYVIIQRPGKNDTDHHMVTMVDLNEKPHAPPHFFILNNDASALLEYEGSRKDYSPAYAFNEQGVWAFPRNTKPIWGKPLRQPAAKICLP